MNIILDPVETRILGCLMEKSVTTPDQYPLTLNAVVNACNQKSSRHPVTNYDPGMVERTLRNLDEKRLVSSKEQQRGGRTVRYTQRLCNTPFAEVELSEAEYALVCLMMLRGAQTPGELRARSGRLHDFADNGEVVEVLDKLISRESGAVVARLPRQPGRQDHEYVHLLSGDAIESVDASPPAAATSVAARPSQLSALEERVTALEAEVARMREVFDQLSD